MVKNLPANAGDTGSIPVLGRSYMLWCNWARAPQLLSLYSKPWEPQLLKPPWLRAHALQQEKPLQWKACTPQLESNPCLLQPEKSPHRNEDPTQPKKNKYFFFLIKISKIFLFHEKSRKMEQNNVLACTYIKVGQSNCWVMRSLWMEDIERTFFHCIPI